MSASTLPWITIEEPHGPQFLAELKSAVVRGLAACAACEWEQEHPALTASFEAGLQPEQRDFLLRCNVIGEYANRLAWKFRPFFGHGLLLFCDLHCRRFREEYVWLRTDTDSGSWTLTGSIPDVEGRTVLDLGSGSGLNALRLTQRGARATGIDINPRAVNVATFNRLLNGLEGSEFIHCDLGTFESRDYDLIISQPPFDPAVSGTDNVYAFTGGSDYGLECTSEIVRRFRPGRPGQWMRLYVHSFARPGEVRLETLLAELLRKEHELQIETLKTHAIDGWWDRYKERHRMNPHMPLPAEWRAFERVDALFVSVFYPRT